MGEQLQLALLGNPEIRRDGVSLVGLTSGKALALLYYLAVTRRPHLRPTLVGLLWGDMPEESARNNLSKALTYLRQAVGLHLDITRQAVAFDHERPYWLDVEAFEQGTAGSDMEGLERAIGLYRGDFLEGFSVRQAPAFEEWVLAQRARLRELALDALYALAVHHTRRGPEGHAAAMGYTARLLALEPWREEAHRQLMLLLASSGQRGAALAQFEACRRVLAEELGVEPGAETVSLYERIRDGRLGALVRSIHGQPTPAGPESSHAAGVVSPPFLSSVPPRPAARAPVIARQRELAQLGGWLAQALAGHGRPVFVTGEAGAGKTALIEEFARRAQETHADLVVAGGNCNAYSGIGDPYRPFREIMGLLTGDVEGRWAAGTLSEEQARRLWSLIPDAVLSLTREGPDLVDIFVPASSLIARARAAAPGSAPWLTELEASVITQR
ncbi:MAG: AAA family ATPase, partial [Anaerolineae bacterium]|nr:AAA family ATPase [Anaerolineae bacterium]